MREVKSAERLYMRALDMEPGHTGALVNLANIVAKTRNDTASAQELYTRALACEPHSAGILNNLALMQVGGAASARSPRP
jgi:Tfp pilus assembly protein PilF